MDGCPRKRYASSPMYITWKHAFRGVFSTASAVTTGVCMAVLICSLVIAPSLAVAQDRGYGQALGAPSPGGEESGDRRFLRKGRLLPRGISEEQRRELSAFQQSVVTYQVHVLGQVENPGTYRISPSTRLDEVLLVAGGVGELGSRRKIKLRRRNMKEKEFDIFDFRSRGNLKSNPYLLDNDVVFVPYADRMVRIEGATRQSGVLELNDEKTLDEVITMAGGMTVDVAIDEPVTVVRFDKKGVRKIIELPNNPKSLKNFTISAGDMIYLPNVIAKGKAFDFNVEDIPGGRTFYPTTKDAIFIIGAVSSPGGYPFNPFSSPEEYVLFAGPSQAANLRGVKVFTTTGKKLKGREMRRHRLSPGDVIIVPEKHITLAKGLMWYNTFASTIMTGFTLQQLIKSFE